MIKYFLSFILFTNVAWASHAPDEHDADDGVQPAFDFRYLHKEGPLTLLTELRAFQNHFDNIYKSLRFGAYWRIHQNIKIGAFIKNQYGSIHDDDWNNDNGGWHWEDTNHRGEVLAVLDFTPRALMADSFVGELKFRYEQNFHNDHQAWKLRPGITYFATRKGKPSHNVYLRYERYFPTNFGNENFYQEWWYLGTMFHTSQRFKPGGYLAFRRSLWVDSDDFDSAFPGQDYEYTEEAVQIGFTFTWIHN